MNSVDTIPMTEDGFESLQAELQDLKSNQRPGIVKAIAEARSHGDLKENAEYHAAREKQAFIEARITELESSLSRVEVIKTDSSANIDSIRFGAWVTLCDEETEEERKFRIVGALESDITKALISINSPIAKAVLGKSIDDIVKISTPGGLREYVVASIEYH